MDAEATGLVLAGGESSRMGQDKSKLKVQGVTLEQRIENTLFDVGVSDVLISRNDFSDGSLPDVYPNRGPLSGIHAAVFATELPIICVPVDMPLLTADLLQELWLVGAEKQTSVFYQGFPLPFYLHPNEQINQYLESHLSDHDADTSVKAFLAKINALPIEPRAPEKLVNVNTPQEWLEAVKRL